MKPDDLGKALVWLADHGPYHLAINRREREALHEVLERIEVLRFGPYTVVWRCPDGWQVRHEVPNGARIYPEFPELPDAVAAARALAAESPLPQGEFDKESYMRYIEAIANDPGFNPLTDGQWI